MRRRDLFKAAPAAALLALPAVALPAVALPAVADTEKDRDRMIAVVRQLEACQGWEPANVVAAKAFAAYQIRKALGLELTGSRLPQDHVDYQRQRFTEYLKSYCHEQDLTAGRAYGFNESLT